MEDDYSADNVSCLSGSGWWWRSSLQEDVVRRESLTVTPKQLNSELFIPVYTLMKDHVDVLVL